MMKLKSMVIGIALSVLVLSLTSTALAYPSVSLKNVRADRSGISGQFGIFGISQNQAVSYYCYIVKQGQSEKYAGAGSSGRGPGWYPFWCRMGSFSGAGYYSAILYANVGTSYNVLAITNWYYVS